MQVEGPTANTLSDWTKVTLRRLDCLIRSTCETFGLCVESCTYIVASSPLPNLMSLPTLHLDKHDKMVKARRVQND